MGNYLQLVGFEPGTEHWTNTPPLIRLGQIKKMPKFVPYCILQRYTIIKLPSLLSFQKKSLKKCSYLLTLFSRVRHRNNTHFFFWQYVHKVAHWVKGHMIKLCQGE